MTEEEFAALEEFIDAKATALIGEALGRESGNAEWHLSEVRQNFIDTFIFGDEP